MVGSKEVAGDSAELDNSYQDWKKNVNTTIASRGG